MKALEKDRTRRYETANGFAADVQRYLSGEPVQALPPSLGYRLKKVYRRNKAAVLVGRCVALVILLAAPSVSVTFGVWATGRSGRRRPTATRPCSAQGVANDERKRANEGAANGTGAQDFTRRLLYASQMSSASTAFAEGRGGQLFRLLDEAKPRSGEPDLRGWEWHFLDRQTRSEREFKLDVPPQPTFGQSRGYSLANGSSPNGASRDRRWIVTLRTVGDGFVFDVTDSATGQRVGQVPKAEVLKSKAGMMQMPLLSEDGRHILVTEWQMPMSSGGGGGLAPAPAPVDTEVKTKLRIWEVASGQVMPAPAESIKFPSRPSQDRMVLGANAAWVSWLEHTQPDLTNRTRGFKGPLEYEVARWDATSGEVKRTKLVIGKGWGIARLSPDGRTVHWYPGSERYAGGFDQGGGSIGNSPVEYGEYQVWDVAKPEQMRCSLRVPLKASPLVTSVVLSPSWTMLAVLDGQTVIVHNLTDGREHWKASVPIGYFEGGTISPDFRNGFAITDDGNRVVFHTRDSMVIVDNAATGRPTERRMVYRSIVDEKGRGNTPLGFTLLPDGRTLIRRDFETVRVWDVDRETGGHRPKPVSGTRQLVTDPDGRSWFVQSTADGRRTVKWSPPPSRDATVAEKTPPRQLSLLDGEGKE